MSRQLNALERRIHEKCMSSSGKTISQKEVDGLAPDTKSGIDAINFLLKAGMIVLLTDKHGTVSYRAVTKKELEVKKEISGDENIILATIQAAKNEGIWTKHIKSKTDMHQTVMTRCLKTLEQKGLIKPIKSVKNPTRKIYIMAHLEPSVEVTGGPWYTDHELDTEFIRMLLAACLRYISDRSFPKTDSDARPLYSISHAPPYASASQVLSFLAKSRITETELQLEHVESLLEVLVHDGLIERLPAFSSISWSVSMAKSDESGDEEEEEKKSSKKKKSQKKSSSSSKKRKRRDEDSDHDESDDDRPKKKKRSKKAGTDDESDSDSDNARSKKKTKKRSKKAASSEDEDDDSDDNSRKKSKKKGSSSKKRRRAASDSESESDSEKEEGSSKRAKKRKKASSTESESDGGSEDEAPVARGPRKSTDAHASVYRAIRQEHVEPLQAWAQAPCAQCPQFEFCAPSGPVNPKGCEYFTKWLLPEEMEF